MHRRRITLPRQINISRRSVMLREAQLAARRLEQSEVQSLEMRGRAQLQARRWVDWRVDSAAVTQGGGSRVHCSHSEIDQGIDRETGLRSA